MLQFCEQPQIREVFQIRTTTPQLLQLHQVFNTGDLFNWERVKAQMHQICEILQDWNFTDFAAIRDIQMRQGYQLTQAWKFFQRFKIGEV